MKPVDLGVDMPPARRRFPRRSILGGSSCSCATRIAAAGPARRGDLHRIAGQDGVHRYLEFLQGSYQRRGAAAFKTGLVELISISPSWMGQEGGAAFA